MSDSDEFTRRPEEEGADRSAAAGQPEPGGADDQAHRTVPPGNPEPDREAVEKGEENIERVTGR